MLDSPARTNKLVERLRKELPGAREADVRAFVEQAMNLEADAAERKPFPEAVRGLLAAGNPAGKVLAALLKCEWTSIQQVTAACREGGAGSNCRNQVAALTACIQHYNDLQAVVVAEAESAWKQTLAEERKHRVLAEARVRWLRDRSIELHNHFMEIPVRAQLEVVDVVEDEIAAMFSSEAAVVFAASDDLRSAWVSAGEGLRLRIYGRERRGNRLMLTVDAVEPDLHARRRYVRIQLEEPAAVIIERRDQEDLLAMIRDKSLHGMGVLLPKAHVRDASRRLSVGEPVTCRWKMDGQELKAEGIVRWHQYGKNDGRAGIEIKPDATVRKHFQDMLMREQRLVIGRLRNLGLPAWLQPQS